LNYTKRMEEIELLLLDFLNTAQSDAIKADGVGTAFKTVKTSVTTADQKAFRDYVIGTGAWHLVDWRPSKTAVQDALAEHNPLPPGVNYSPFPTVNIRRS